MLTDQPVLVNESSQRPLPCFRCTPQTGKHACGSCGKFRSPSYCKRHPLADGEQPKPSLCRKCAKGSTDSGSDDSHKKYKKEQKRRRGRDNESSDERWERCRRGRRNGKRRSGSGEYFYESSREEERYRGPRREYSVDERNSYSDWERRERPRIIYVSRSSSQRHTRSSSGNGTSVIISYKSAEPRKLRRSSRSRSSAEEIRVVRRVIEKPERRRRPLARSMSEESYRRHYRSVSGSSAGKSVRFRSPIRRYRGRGYDGEMASYEEIKTVPLGRPPEPTRLLLGFTDVVDRRVYPLDRRPASPVKTRHKRNQLSKSEITEKRDHSGTSSAEEERGQFRTSPAEEPGRPPSRSFHHVRGSSEIREAASRFRREEQRSHSSAPSLMSGTRGRSLSRDRQALEKERSRERVEARLRREARAGDETAITKSETGGIPRKCRSQERLIGIC